LVTKRALSNQDAHQYQGRLRGTSRAGQDNIHIRPTLTINWRRTCGSQPRPSDSRCRGVSPAHEHSCPGFLKRVTSPISATITAPGHRADAGQGADRLVSLVVLEQPGDDGFQHGDLARPCAARSSSGIRLRQLQAVQPGGAPDAEDVGAGDRDAELGQHGMVRSARGALPASPPAGFPVPPPAPAVRRPLR